MRYILLRLEFLQDLASFFIAGISPHITHNLEKYYALKKVFSLSVFEDTEGDYLEFGVFRGSSFCHSIRCFKRLSKGKLGSRTRFYGFDSFAGFGELDEADDHPFYKDANFETSLPAVERRIRRVAGATVETRLVPGFFSESLKDGAKSMGIEKAKIVFIDSDTFASADEALSFCLPIVSVGTFIVLDDYFSYGGREDRGVCRAFSKFVAEGSLKVRQVFTYGSGGAVFVVSGK